MQCSLNFVRAIKSRLKGGTCSTNGSVVVLVVNFRQDLKYCVRKSLIVPAILRNMLARVQFLSARAFSTCSNHCT